MRTVIIQDAKDSNKDSAGNAVTWQDTMQANLIYYQSKTETECEEDESYWIVKSRWSMSGVEVDLDQLRALLTLDRLFHAERALQRVINYCKALPMITTFGIIKEIAQEGLDYGL